MADNPSGLPFRNRRMAQTAAIERIAAQERTSPEPDYPRTRMRPMGSGAPAPARDPAGPAAVRVRSRVCNSRLPTRLIPPWARTP